MKLLVKILLACIVATCIRSSTAADQQSSFEQVGRSTNHIILPVNQTLTPAGIQVELPGLRPQVIKLSPDGRLLATSGKTSELLLIDPVTGKILQRVAMPSENADAETDPVSSHILSPDKNAE